MRRICRERRVLIIRHRLSTIRGADRIISIEARQVEAVTVSTIDIINGDHVQPGQILITLDLTQVEADQGRITYDLLQTDLDKVRLMGLRQRMGTNQTLALVNPPLEVSPLKIEITSAAMQVQDAGQTARLTALDHQVVQKHAEADEVAASCLKMQAFLLWTERVAQLRRNVKNLDFGNKISRIDAEQRLTDTHCDMAILGAKQREARAAQRSLKRRLGQSAAEYEKTFLSDLTKAAQKINQPTHDKDKIQTLDLFIKYMENNNKIYLFNQ